jgi:fibronectin type 3 domain-containing protein
MAWNAPTSSVDPVTGYNIYRSPSGAGTYQLLNSSPDTGTSYTDPGVTSGQSYDYYVESVDASGNLSVPSNTTTVTIP